MGAPGLDLVADCGSCFGLCCVALPFTRSADFAFSKAGGEPCHNLREDFGCGVHSSLRDLGMPGCTVFDCFGAGQAVSQKMYAGKDWCAPAVAAPGGADSERASEMFEVFASVRRLHEMLFYLTSALDQLSSIDGTDTGTDSSELRDRLGSLRDETQALAEGTAYDVLGVDVDAHRLEVAPLLREASATIRSATPRGVDLERVGASDLAGRDLSRLDLRSADLRGSLLIGASLAGSDLRWADLLGADLRACDVRGADLTNALFLTQMQVNAAHGDASTDVGPGLTRPSHWA
ncbi:hypothetical protein ASG90_12635 [Nocardioides sp. Soil797]|nr:hypothetical protein ASG90_12635 [Nocardioides sp. Soil797]